MRELFEAREQDAPDESDYRGDAEANAKDYAWGQVKLKYPELMFEYEDVMSWLFNDAWNYGARFADDWTRTMTRPRGEA